MKFRALYFSLILLMFLSCSKNNGTLEFCEGTDADGKGVNCGSVFSEGDLSIILKSKIPFESEQLTVKLYDDRNSSPFPVETITVPVKQGETVKAFDYALYNSGVYKLVVEGKDGKTIAEGIITVASQPVPAE